MTRALAELACLAGFLTAFAIWADYFGQVAS